MTGASARPIPARDPPRRAFVTGATGFVGANLVRVLREGSSEVRALVRTGSDLSSLQGVTIDLREGSLHDSAALARHMEGCDACFHVAAAITAEDPQVLYQINADGTRTVLEAAASAGCSIIIHTSTMGTLRRPDGRPAREDDSGIDDGASHYVRSKLAGEEIARQLAGRGAPVVIVQPSAPVGAWDRGPTVTGRRIVDVLERRLPRWIAGAINHVAVRDVVRGMILAAQRGRPGQNYLLARIGGDLTRDQFVALVSRAAAMPPPRGAARLPFLSWLRGKRQAAPGGPASLACDPSWSVKELGLPQTPLEEAFEEAVKWFRGS